MKSIKQDSYFHIAFCVNDNYVQYICVTIKSILVNNPNLILWFHILTDGISKKSEKKLFSLLDSSNLQNKISIHVIDDHDLDGVKVGFWTKYTWYRIFLPQILKNINRILYLDADTLVLGNLKPLLEINLTNISFAAVTEDYFEGHLKPLNIDPLKPYYCAGVMLMNLEYWRNNFILEKILEFAYRNNKILEFPDQDCINVVCQNSSIHLPIKYGITPTHITRNTLHDKYKEEIKEGLISPIIIHYLGWHEQPWFGTCSHYANNLWHLYNKSLKNRAQIKYDGTLFEKLKIIFWNYFYDRSKNQKKLVQRILAQ